jgi:hypothetical protein
MRKPLQFAIYKGMGGKFGAVQANFQPPHYYRMVDGRNEKDFGGSRALDHSGRIKETEGWKQREGAVFLEATSPSGPNQYNWENKVTVALSVTDMSKLALGLTTGKETKLMHDPGAKTERAGVTTKHITLSSPEGVMNKGCMLQVSQKTGDDRRSHTIPLSPDECLSLRTLLLTAIPKALAWE